MKIIPQKINSMQIKYCCHKYYSALIPCKNQFFACVKINNATGSQNYIKEILDYPSIHSAFKDFYTSVLNFWLRKIFFQGITLTYYELA